MIDASSLIAERQRTRGRRLIALPEHELAISAHAWSEVHHELPQRLEERERHGHLAPGGAAGVLAECLRIATRYIRIVSANAYAEFEVVARRRIRRDPQDWPTDALARALEARIWTADTDFLGRGLPTWTTETLLLDLGASA